MSYRIKKNSKVRNQQCYKKWRDILIVSLTLIIVCTTTIFAMDSSKIVITINEEPIYLEEFMLLYNGDKEKTFKLAIEAKCKQMLAKEYEVIEDIDYKSFQKQLDEENKRRKEVINTGEVIYGPQQYTEKQYYNYLISNNMAEVEVIIEGEEKDKLYGNIEKIYEENIENYKLEDAVTIDVISISFVNEDGMVDEIIKSEAKKYGDSIRENLVTGDKSMITDEQYKVEKKEMTFNYESKIIDENYHPELKEKALELVVVEEISNVIEFNGAYNILVLKDRYDQGYEPLENLKDQIVVEQINNIINEKLDRLAIYVEVNNQVYSGIK